MSAADINKIAGAVLVTLLASTVIGIIAHELVPEGTVAEHAAPAPRAAATPAATPASRPAAPVQQAAAPAAAAPAAAPAAPAPQVAAVSPEEMLKLIAAADKDAGRKLMVRCAACHKWEDGAANGVGPVLWGVVGRKKGDEKVTGFEYSEAMEKKGGNWTFQDLDAFLTSPKTFVPGTKMTFTGIANPADRASVIAFLRGQSASPLPLP